MIELTNIYGHNITDLITNNKREINDNDKDCQCMLKSLKEIPSNANRNLIIAGFNSIESGKESYAIESKPNLERMLKEPNHFTKLKFVCHCLQTFDDPNRT